MGYKQTGTVATEGIITVYVLVPASTTTRGPNIDYIPIMKKGTTFNSEASGIFTLQEDIDFSDPQTRWWLVVSMRLLVIPLITQ